jgi:hypothetical protein
MKRDLIYFYNKKRPTTTTTGDLQGNMVSISQCHQDLLLRANERVLPRTSWLKNRVKEDTEHVLHVGQQAPAVTLAFHLADASRLKEGGEGIKAVMTRHGRDFGGEPPELLKGRDAVADPRSHLRKRALVYVVVGAVLRVRGVEEA